MSISINFSQYQNVRKHTESLCTPLKEEDYVVQPVDFISPAKWHLAHTTWFFEQFILKSMFPGYREYNSQYGFLFNSYYNHVGTRSLRAHRGNMTRPTVKEVYEYRHYVDLHIQQVFSLKKDDPVLKDLIVIGINHEQQHQELLLTDIKYILGHNPLFPVYQEGTEQDMSVNDTSGMQILAEGVYEIGATNEGFSFDNEHGRHKAYIQKTEIAQELVINGEYLEFMNAGGYKNFDHWLDEGWSWINQQKISSPLYWHFLDDKWHHFTLSGLKEVKEDHILTHISYYEAAAFAEWKGMRLPTEFEWEAANQLFKWGKRWEWTASAYLPYPGYSKKPGALGEYNGKFMVNQMVLRGGSIATPIGHTRATYRNFFHPHHQWQFSGIRLATR